MNILQLNSSDFGGGASKIARDLSVAYAEQGNNSLLGVGKKRLQLNHVFQLQNREPLNVWEKLNFGAANISKRFIGKIKGAGKATELFESMARYQNSYASFRGYEDFYYPATKKLFTRVLENEFDVMHGHNLHGKYFDLRMLAKF